MGEKIQIFTTIFHGSMYKPAKLLDQTPLLRTDDDKNNHKMKRIWLQTDFRFKSYREECSSRVVGFWIFRLLRLKAQVHVYCKINKWIPIVSFVDPYWKIYWILELFYIKKITQ